MAALKPFLVGSRSSDGSPSELRATLAEHLEELRHRITRVLGVCLVGTIGGWFFTNQIFQIFRSMAMHAVPKGVELKLTFLGVASSFMFTLTLAFSLGLMVVIPYAVLELWGFISPGLRPHEKKPLKYVAPISVFLFFLGVFLAWVIMPVTFQWFFIFTQGYDGTTQMVEPQELIFFPVSIMLAFGLGFQMPIVIYFLAWLEIINPKMLLRYWRHGIVGIMVAAAVITPSGDIPTMMMMAIPLTILYFLTLFAALINKRKHQQTELDDLD